MTVSYTRSSFCNIFCNWKSSCGPQEKLSQENLLKSF